MNNHAQVQSSLQKVKYIFAVVVFFISYVFRLVGHNIYVHFHVQKLRNIYKLCDIMYNNLFTLNKKQQQERFTRQFLERGGGNQEKYCLRAVA